MAIDSLPWRALRTSKTTIFLQRFQTDFSSYQLSVTDLSRSWVDCVSTSELISRAKNDRFSIDLLQPGNLEQFLVRLDKFFNAEDLLAHTDISITSEGHTLAIKFSQISESLTLNWIFRLSPAVSSFTRSIQINLLGIIDALYVQQHDLISIIKEKDFHVSAVQRELNEHTNLKYRPRRFIASASPFDEQEWKHDWFENHRSSSSFDNFFPNIFDQVLGYWGYSGSGKIDLDFQNLADYQLPDDPSDLYSDSSMLEGADTTITFKSKKRKSSPTPLKSSRRRKLRGVIGSSSRPPSKDTTQELLLSSPPDLNDSATNQTKFSLSPNSEHSPSFGPTSELERLVAERHEKIAHLTSSQNQTTASSSPSRKPVRRRF
ncbi:uncharacterized protein V1516DRAFT_674086 [Lipomyces oligophaga]|uniref:uncharacterized protein n=1 Tax=Lipomyces oligophaga TaxID=45792 RepID=UPI0034CE0C79